MPRMDTVQIDLGRSMEFDKEQFLNDLVESVQTTREEFDRLYILEEFPIEVGMTDYTDFKGTVIEYAFITQQSFHIRRKTPEETAGDQSHIITQGEED